jgi:3-methyladenine DNA glycosylase/8-oxoguanine DNA glycosylase
MESGKWKVESGKWKVESGKWKVTPLHEHSNSAVLCNPLLSHCEQREAIHTYLKHLLDCHGVARLAMTASRCHFDRREKSDRVSFRPQGEI